MFNVRLKSIQKPIALAEITARPPHSLNRGFLSAENDGGKPFVKTKEDLFFLSKDFE